MTRHRDSRSFTEAQLGQHEVMANQLQRANAVAAQALLMLRRFRPGQKRYQRVCIDLANIVRRMIVLIGCCEQIATTGFEKRFSRINVILGTTCEYCEETGGSADRRSSQGHGGILEAAPAWGVLVEYLLSQATSIIHRTIAVECFSSEFEEPWCLHDLVKVLLRQQRYLARIGSTRAPEIVVIYDPGEVCSDCGQKEGAFVDDDVVRSPGIP